MMHDVRHRIGKREQLADAALRFGARRERLHEIGRVDAALPQRVLGERERRFDRDRPCRGRRHVLLQHRGERPLRAAADDRDADGLALQVLDLLDRRVVLHGPVKMEAVLVLADVLRDDVERQRIRPHASRLRDRQHALRRAIERARGQRLRHRRGALELRPLDLVGLAEVRGISPAGASSSISIPRPEWSSRRGWCPALSRPTQRRSRSAPRRQLVSCPDPIWGGLRPPFRLWNDAHGSTIRPPKKQAMRLAQTARLLSPQKTPHCAELLNRHGRSDCASLHAGYEPDFTIKHAC